MKKFFVTGTGTDIGKTHITCGLIAGLRAQGYPASAIKPIVSGWNEAGLQDSDTGQLLTMVGGDHKVFERTRRYLDPICEHIFYIGESGTGHTLKLLHNIICHVTTLGTAEAGHMAERAGISLKTMIDVFNVSNARSYSSEFRFPRHIISETWDGRSSIFNLHKDIGMGERLAKSLGADARYTNATLDILNKAMSIGMQNDDYTLLYRDFEKIRKA